MGMVLAKKKDFLLVTVTSLIFGLFLLPILENIQPAFWRFNFQNTSLVVVGLLFFGNFALWVGDLIGRKYVWVWQFAKYGAVGSMAAATNFGMLNLLSLLTGVFSGVLIIVFNIAAFAVTVTNAYFWHKFWSFGQDSKPRLIQFSRYLAVTISSAVIDSLIVYFFTTFIEAPGGLSPADWENIGKAIAVVPVVIFNFLGYRFFVFRTEAENDKKELI